jgi:predicted nucleotide-binding protein
MITSDTLDNLLSEGLEVLQSRTPSGVKFIYDSVDSMLYHKWVMNCISFLGSDAPDHVERIRAVHQPNLALFHQAEQIYAILQSATEFISARPEPTTRRSAQRGVTPAHLFVVHGQDEAAKETVARFLEKLDLKPIILHEQANKGLTLIEKLEVNAEVDFAVVLLTPDDVGYSVGEDGKAKPRARQNVILELGYFLGYLGRGRVCALHKGDVEIPSDFHGVVYVPMDDAQGWRVLLAREIRAAGIDVDLNRAIEP